MKKIGVLVGCIVGFDVLIGSQKSRQSQEVVTMLGTTQAKALFFAIEQGCDHALIAKILTNVVKNCPNKVMSSVVIAQAEELFRTKSPHVVKLKAQINSGATPAAQRGQLQEQLQVMLKTGQVPDPSFLKKSKF